LSKRKRSEAASAATKAEAKRKRSEAASAATKAEAVAANNEKLARELAAKDEEASKLLTGRKFRACKAKVNTTTAANEVKKYAGYATSDSEESSDAGRYPPRKKSTAYQKGIRAKKRKSKNTERKARQARAKKAMAADHASAITESDTD
jgi:hypothetical protein